MNKEVIEQAVKVAKTPVYIFDLDLLQDGIARLKEHTGKNVELCYAIKANPFLVPEIEPRVSFVEACSMGEIKICMEQNIPITKIIMSGILKKAEELDEIFAGKELPVITAESVEQFEMIRKRATEKRKEVKVLLRLTSGNQFGMNPWEIEQTIQRWKNSGFVHIIGIHYFSGTKKKKKEKIVQELFYLDEICKQLEKKYGFVVKHMEYGPGIDVNYFQNDVQSRNKKQNQREEESQRELLDDIDRCVAKMNFKGRLVLEIGRYLAAECGVYVTKVREVKENDGIRYAITDGGIHQINYDGQIYGMFLPEISQIPERKKGRKEMYDLCGALCTTNDILAKQAPLYPLMAEDYLVFGKAGAYAVTEGMALFLSRELPAVLTASKKDGIRMLRKSRSTYDLNMNDKGEQKQWKN